jgi:hypothetical protein
MVIECVIKREGPTEQHIGGVRYIFKPRPELTGGDKKANVAEIQKEEIVEYLLQNPNFRQYIPAPTSPAVNVGQQRQLDEKSAEA